MRHLSTAFAIAFTLAASFVYAQDVALRAPSAAVAGTAASIGSTGGGLATFYLVGPSLAVKREVQLGGEIAVSGNELRSSGRYVATVCAAGCSSVAFFVSPAKPVNLTFLVHPSRVPVKENDAISGVALPFDEFRNLVLAPASVNFQWSAKGSSSVTRTAQSRGGVAWFRTNSGTSAGALQLTAVLSDITARRMVQQVASDPCNIRIKGQRNAKGIAVETEPVRDCAGNPVPDGTIVTFTARAGNEMSTVDAPLKQDVARAQILAKGAVTISAASGVVMGNELRINGKD